MNNIKFKLGNCLLKLDDWFAKYHIHLNLFSKDKDNHASFFINMGIKFDIR